MEILGATVSQMAVLFSFILIGWLLARLGVVDKSAAGVLAKLENNVFIPALVMGTFINNFTFEKLGPAWQLFAVSMALTVVMAVVAVLISRAASRDRYVQNVFTYGLAFSNFGFMGNAVVKVVFPDIFLEYLIFTLPLWMLIYLWGVPYLLTPSEQGKVSVLSRLKSFVNPMFIGMVIGIVVGLASIPMPKWLTSVITVSGDCMSPVAMILTGITLYGIDFKKIARRLNIYAVSFIRLIVLPLIAVGVFYLFPDIPDVFVICTVCSLAMPLGLNTVVIPSAYGKDTSVAAGMTIISHVLSCATIPAVFWLMMQIIQR